MKKLKILSIVLLICSTALMAAFLIGERITLDVTAPVISCPEEPLRVSIHEPEEAFLAGVTALDDRSGDVTNALVVEKLSAMGEDGSRIVTYAVIDRAGNVGRAERQLFYTDYTRPRFYFSDALRFDLGNRSGSLLGAVRVISPLDGDMTDRIRYVQVDNSSLYTPGSKQLELRVTDSTGTTVSLPVTVDMYYQDQEAIRVELRNYLLYLPQGAAFDPQMQFSGAEPEGTLTIEGGVDTHVPGVYELDYVVRSGDDYGKSRLVVVVEPPEREAN